MQKVIEIKRITDKTPYFLLDLANSEVGDKVVVNFDEFQTIATVTKTDINLDSSKQSELSKVIRKATESDLKKFDELSKKAKKELKSIKKLSLNLGLMMKFVSAEFHYAMNILLSKFYVIINHYGQNQKANFLAILGI